MSVSPSEPVDWRLASRVAGLVAGAGPAIPPRARARMRHDFAELAEVSDRLVRDFTGLDPAEAATAPSVLDRAGWIRVNLEGFRSLMRPIERRLAGEGGSFTRRLTRAGLGAQVGVLLGYLAKKVLGQYDLLLAAGGAGRVYFVAPNVAAAERRAGVPARDFRLWITLHEVTHRTQFAAAPWLRDHLKDLVGRYLASVDLDGKRIRESFGRVVEAIQKGPASLRQLDVLSLFLTPDQQQAVARMQAVMTVVEGHGNFVMDRVGAEHIRGQRRMKEAFARQRARTSGPERLLQRALGVDLKYQQYARGEAFVTAVHARAGMDGVNRVWSGPESLPTPAEIADPEAWLARLGGAPAGTPASAPGPGPSEPPGDGRQPAT